MLTNEKPAKFEVDWNLVFVTMLLVIVLVIGIVSYLGSKQNEYYKQTQTNFFKGISMYQQGANKEAELAISKTVKQYPDSHQVATVYAQVLYDNEEFAEALNYMQKAEQIYPAVVANPKFLYEYAKVLLANGEFANAQLHLEQAIKVGNDPDLVAQADQLLKAVVNFQKLGR